MSDSSYINSVCVALGAVIHDYILQQIPSSTISADTIASLCESWYDSQTRSEVTLSAVKPDIRQIIEQLQTYLSTHSSWKDTITASTGQFIVDLIAGVGALNQLSIERAVHETMLKTSVMGSSIIANTRNLGVHVHRKVCAKVTATLSNSDTSALYVIPKYSSFSIGGSDFFNREPIIFNEGVSQLDSIPLYQGTVYNYQTFSTGEVFQRVEIGNSDFKISDSDIDVTVDGVTFSRTTDGLFRYGSNSGIFDENTMPSGNVEIRFGNGTFGISPKIGSTISVTYAETQGYDANSAEVGLTVSYSGNSTISGITTSTITGGQDEWDTQLYKIMAPSMYSSKKRMVTREDHNTLAMSYPGMIDIKFRGQSQTFPTDKNYMNVVLVTPLATNTAKAWTKGENVAAGVYRTNDSKTYVSTNSGVCGNTAPTHITGTVSDGTVTWTFYSFGTDAPWDDAKFTDFKNFLNGEGQYTQPYVMFSLNYVLSAPTPLPFTVVADVYCSKNSDLSNLSAYLKDLLINELKPTYGSLGKKIEKSDIYNTLVTTHKDYGSVDYVVLSSPSSAVASGLTEYAVLNPNIQLTMYYTDRS